MRQIVRACQSVRTAADNDHIVMAAQIMIAPHTRQGAIQALGNKFF